MAVPECRYEGHGFSHCDCPWWRRWWFKERPIRGPISGTHRMPKVVLPEGFEPPSAAVIGAQRELGHPLTATPVEALREARDFLAGAIEHADFLGYTDPQAGACTTRFVLILIESALQHNDGDPRG